MPHIVADVAIPNTTKLLQEGRKRVLRAIEREKKKIDDSLKRYYPEKRKKALKIRKRIEAKFGEAKKHYRMVRARYRGRWRVAIQVFMSFIVMNLKRVVKLLKIGENSLNLALSSG